MRLFGKPGGTLNQARATYVFVPPFDLSFVVAAPFSLDDDSFVHQVIQTVPWLTTLYVDEGVDFVPPVPIGLIVDFDYRRTVTVDM